MILEIMSQKTLENTLTACAKMPVKTAPQRKHRRIAVRDARLELIKFFHHRLKNKEIGIIEED